MSLSGPSIVAICTIIVITPATGTCDSCDDLASACRICCIMPSSIGCESSCSSPLSAGSGAGTSPPAWAADVAISARQGISPSCAHADSGSAMPSASIDSVISGASFGVSARAGSGG